MGKALGNTCVTNLWIPDGMKDTPIDRVGPRRAADRIARRGVRGSDRSRRSTSTPSKESSSASAARATSSARTSFTSATPRRGSKLLCLDTGHYHPTETVTDKLSSVLVFLPEILLHVSRGVRWDSDHVVLLNDDLEALAHELVRGNFLDRTHIGLDFFDASINRVAAWTIGTRNMIKALLEALLEPTDALRELEIDRRLHGAPRAARGTQDAAVRSGVGLLLPVVECPGRRSVAGGNQDVRARGADAQSLAIGRLVESVTLTPLDDSLRCVTGPWRCSECRSLCAEKSVVNAEGRRGTEVAEVERVGEAPHRAARGPAPPAMQRPDRRQFIQLLFSGV